MIILFVKTFQNNLVERRTQTIVTTAGLLFAMFVLWMIMSFTFFGLLIAIVTITVAAYFVHGLSWFWGKSDAEKLDGKNGDADAWVEETTVDEYPKEIKASSVPENEATINHHEYDESPLVEGAVTPRETPQGTRLISKTTKETVVEIKAAVQFWCWFMPLAFSVVSLFGSPFGVSMGYVVFTNAPQNYRLSAVSYSMWGGFWWIAIFLALAIISYFMTRPKVSVIITQDTIRFGSYKFDRQFTGGLRIGYSTDQTNLSQSFLQPKFGMVALRLTYGEWGEDMKYLVNAYHANEIVNWSNQIIESVGEPVAARNDPYAGRKIELL